MKPYSHLSESLDQLEAWAREKMSPVKNKNVVPYVSPHLPLEAAHLTVCAFQSLFFNFGFEKSSPSASSQKKIFVVPVKDSKQLDIVFQFPSVDPHFLSKVCLGFFCFFLLGLI